jgi:hypothetical protein
VEISLGTVYQQKLFQKTNLHTKFGTARNPASTIFVDLAVLRRAGGVSPPNPARPARHPFLKGMHQKSLWRQSLHPCPSPVPAAQDRHPTQHRRRPPRPSWQQSRNGPRHCRHFKPRRTFPRNVGSMQLTAQQLSTRFPLRLNGDGNLRNLHGNRVLSCCAVSCTDPAFLGKVSRRGLK